MKRAEIRIGGEYLYRKAKRWAGGSRVRVLSVAPASEGAKGVKVERLNQSTGKVDDARPFPFDVRPCEIISTWVE